MFYKKSILKNFSKFTGKHRRWTLFFNKVTDWILPSLLTDRLHHRYFPMIFPKFLRMYFIQNTSMWLLLKLGKKNTKHKRVSKYHNSYFVYGINFSVFSYTQNQSKLQIRKRNVCKFAPDLSKSTSDIFQKNFEKLNFVFLLQEATQN